MEFVIGKQILNFRLKWQSVLLLLSQSTFAFTGLSAKLPEKLELFFENHCMDCHDDEITEGGLDFLSLTRGSWFFSISLTFSASWNFFSGHR